MEKKNEEDKEEEGDDDDTTEITFRFALFFSLVAPFWVAFSTP